MDQQGLQGRGMKCICLRSLVICGQGALRGNESILMDIGGYVSELINRWYERMMVKKTKRKD